MPESPALIEVALQTLLQKFLPTAGTAAMIYALVVFLFGPRLRMLAAWLAMAASWGVINSISEAGYGLLPWWPTNKLVEWLPLLALGAMTVGTLSEIPVPWLVRLVIYGAAAIGTGWMITPELVQQAGGETVKKKDWLMMALVAGGAGLNAVVGWYLAQRHPGGLVPFTQSLSLMGCGGIIIYAHSAKMMDISMAFGSGLFGIALVASLTQSNAGFATSAMGMLLPAMAITARQGTVSNVPMDSFIAVAVAPGVMGLSLLLPVDKLLGRLSWLVPLGFLSIPLGWAMMRAMQFEELAI